MKQNIGRYQIIGTLGQGAMATVYKAHDPKINRDLAIKVLRAEHCVDAEYRTRFVREAHAVGTLSHPNIVTIYDIGEIDNTPYIAMELLNGTPLDEIMKSENKPVLKGILHIAIQLSLALDFAHNNGIIHRDIKPSNIILVDQETVKITDFGIAKIEAMDMTQHTQIGEVLGTPQYMSPEQVLGKQADARSDLFSIGVILYQMLTGRKPFLGKTLATLLFQIATENPEPIGQLAPTLPNSLKQIINKLLKKNPEQRFQSGQELAHALQCVLDDVSEQTHNKTRIIPIRIKWSLTMGIAVCITFITCGSFLYRDHYELMNEQALNYGSSLVKFIATESAESVLSEDWASVELFVHDAVERQQFSYLSIIDHNHIIRGHNEPSQLGLKYSPPFAKSELISSTPSITVKNYISQDEQTILDFNAPILYKNIEIGRTHLGLPKTPLENAANQTILMIGILMLTTLLSVTIVAYILGKLLSQPINALQKALGEISIDHLSYRISSERKDEFGELFSKFNDMAENLQRRDDQKSEKQ